MKTDVVIVGGGLQGCSTALQLAMRGVSCAIIEKNYVGRHASGVNAGGVRRLDRDIAEVPLSVASMEMWWRIAELVDDDCEFHAAGQVHVAETDAEFRQLEEREKQMRALGYEHEEVVDGDELFRMVPALSRHCLGAIVARRDGYASPMRTMRAFRLKAEELGVRIFQETRVEAIERTADGWRTVTSRGPFEAPVLVNCAGAWGDVISAAVGDEAPLEVAAPMMMITQPVAPFVTQVVGAVGRHVSFKQRPNGTVFTGGGIRCAADRVKETTHLDFRKLAEGAHNAVALFPSMKGARVVRCWAGIEGCMPDDLPVIGPSPQAPGVFHAFGFSAHGFQLGPIVGRIMADLITEGRTELPIEPFRIERFQ
jgi:sarcosine oxidase, subunit beta